MIVCHNEFSNMLSSSSKLIDTYWAVTHDSKRIITVVSMLKDERVKETIDSCSAMIVCYSYCSCIVLYS